MDDSAQKNARILIVDHREAGIRLLERVLEVSEFTNVVSTTDSSRVVTLCAEDEPDLILLALDTPEPDGFEVLAMLTPWTRGTARLPILALASEPSPEQRRRALAAGARDVVAQPVDPSEVLLRIGHLLEGRLTNVELRDRNRELELAATEQSRDLEEARLEVLHRVAVAADYRDDGTYEHTQRVGRTAALLAIELRLPTEATALIRRAAPLHDVGKLGISDAILLKPGRLKPEEFELMKTHVLIGAEILARGRWPLLQMSEEIARTHHERWDGTGYLSGLKGESIPLTGRIVALADSFDALTHRRAYKEATPVSDAVAEIRRLSGEHFDPRVVEAFERLDHEALLAPVEDSGLPF